VRATKTRSPVEEFEVRAYSLLFYMSTVFYGRAVECSKRKSHPLKAFVKQNYCFLN